MKELKHTEEFIKLLETQVVFLKLSMDRVNEILKETNAYKMSKSNKRPLRGWSYDCGHRSDGIVIDNSSITIVNYVVWKSSTGFEGNNKECFPCYCKRLKKSLQKNIK